MNDFHEKTELEKKLEQEAKAAQSAGDESPEPKTDAGEAVDAEAAAPAEEPEQAADDELATLINERDSYRDQLLRARAEFDNYRKRIARDMAQERKMAARDLVRDLLPALDNLGRALAHVEKQDDPLVQGVEMVLRQVEGVLAARGLEPIPAVGEPFDPNIHEALAQQPSPDYAADVIMTEYERGYRMGDQVLRPAKVVVSSGAPQPENIEEE